MSDPRLPILAELEKKILWLASWTIHNANHIRANEDGMKVGGHQDSLASLATIMTALYMAALKPQDRGALKPHASPIFHAINYLMGLQTQEKLANFRGYKGAQSYAFGAVKAVTSASLALTGDGTHAVHLDACVGTMRQSGIDMNERYKKTRFGGLAVNVVEC
jgi:hypothetical protein